MARLEFDPRVSSTVKPWCLGDLGNKNGEVAEKTDVQAV